MPAKTYKVETHSKALNEAILKALSKSFRSFFFPFPVSQPPCDFMPFMFQDFLENWALELNWTPLCRPFFAVTSCSVGSVSTSFEFLVIEASLAQSGRGTRNPKIPLKGFQGCDKNGLNESIKMSPYFIPPFCLPGSIKAIFLTFCYHLLNGIQLFAF